jgi:enoyl-[acyl-carrier-protein] reductase (NADH)
LTEYVSNNKALYDTEIAANPLHRSGGDTDIAGVAIMLASNAGAFITGEIIRVDGGATLVS